MITWIKFCQSNVGMKKICIQFSKTKIIMFSNLGKKQNQENIANVSHLSGCRNFSRGHMIMLYIFKMQYRSISFERTNSHDHTKRGTHCSSIRAKTRFPPGVAHSHPKKTLPSVFIIKRSFFITNVVY